MIDLDDVDDVNIIMGLGEVLAALDIKSSETLLMECDDALTAQSCPSCGEHIDYKCGCAEDGYGYAREYDDEASYEDGEGSL
jgi:hypothetical protein